MTERRTVTVLPGIRDRGPCRSRPFYQGDVFVFEPQGRTRIARVWGPTLEMMRARKHAVARALNALENSEAWPPRPAEMPDVVPPTCVECGDEFDPDTGHVDHLHPYHQELNWCGRCSSDEESEGT